MIRKKRLLERIEDLERGVRELPTENGGYRHYGLTEQGSVFVPYRDVIEYIIRHLGLRLKHFPSKSSCFKLTDPDDDD